jgi:hypothetical protein
MPDDDDPEFDAWFASLTEEQLANMLGAAMNLMAVSERALPSISDPVEKIKTQALIDDVWFEYTKATGVKRGQIP